MPFIAKITTGTALFSLDFVIILAAWPIVLWVGGPHLEALSSLLQDPRGFIYPLLNLLLLFAMGLYRREAILEAGRAFTRVPLVVGMGATLAALVSLSLPVLTGHAASLVQRDRAAVFALATMCFTLCAWAARLVLHGLLRGQVLRRRLLIVGAGQRAWDLLLMLGKAAACTTT